MTDEPTLVTFDFDGEVEFRVDRGKREIAGLIVPWGKVATTGFAEWRFQPGTIEWSETSRVKLLRDHDTTNPQGVALALEERKDGLYGTYKVRRGASGDETLELAEDGILDGFSAGLLIERGNWVADNSGVRDVSRARLRETTITAMPAFDDARVTRVAAMVEIKDGAIVADDKGKNKSGEGGNTTVVENEDDTMKVFDAALDAKFDSVTDKLIELQKSASEGITESVSKALTSVFEQLEGTTAAPKAQQAAARIRFKSEEPIYRFDGAPRAPSMVRDFWRAQTERDHEAVERLRKFQEQQRDMVDLLYRLPVEARSNVANFVDTSSASDVIPPGYRPDLFVNELRQGRPLVAQSSRGTISDATPFVVPRFVSSSGATADHVEGTNPTAGTITLDQETVSPGAISGGFELTREIVDAANPAIDAIALGAMRESYNRQTETKAYALLNGTASVGNTETVSLAALQADPPTEVAGKFSRKLLARYPFSRFAAPTGAVISQTVTVNFAAAEDTTGRPLFPSVGASDTTGLGNAVTQGWTVDGLPHVPAWAMTEGVGDDVGIIVNRADFWTWESPLLTFRFEEKQGPAIIEMSLFAYYGTQVLRPAGIFALRAAA